MVLEENLCILIQIKLKFVLNGVIDSNPAPAQAMAWQKTDRKPLPEPMMTEVID